jgi:hypothetical protein
MRDENFVSDFWIVNFQRKKKSEGRVKADWRGMAGAETVTALTVKKLDIRYVPTDIDDDTHTKRKL